MERKFKRDWYIVCAVLFAFSAAFWAAGLLTEHFAVKWTLILFGIFLQILLGRLVFLKIRGDYREKKPRERSTETALSRDDTMLISTEDNHMPRFAVPDEQEKTFLKRSVAYGKLTGKEKRLQMLKDLYDDYTAKLRFQREWERRMQERGVATAIRYRKTSWSMLNAPEEFVEEPLPRNEMIRSCTVDFLRGVPDLPGDLAVLERERLKIGQRSREVSGKTMWSVPGTEEIRRHLVIGKAAVQKESSGVLSVSLPVALAEHICRDFPEETAIDGTLTGEVWFGDIYVGGVVFPLPLEGMPCDLQGELILTGICGRSVDAEGEYTVKLGRRQNLWIMEV